MYHADQFVAHRGYTAKFPENTLTAFTAAIIAGARHIELDIQFSKDGIAMVYHDLELLRVSGKAGQIVDFTADELEQFSAYEPERLGDRFKNVPISRASELAELIKAKHDTHFYIELKEECLCYFSIEYCLTSFKTLFADVLDQCTFISFDLEAMKIAKQQFQLPQTGIVLRNWEQRNQLITEHHADIAFINLHRIPNDEAISAICPLVVYEIDNPVLAAKTLDRGAAKIETFSIGELIEALCK